MFFVVQKLFFNPFFDSLKQSKRADLRNTLAMGIHLSIVIWILMLKSTKGQVIYDDLNERQQNSLNSAMYYIKNELQQMTKSVENMLLQKLEEMENNLHTKVKKENENVTKFLVENFTETLENKLTCFSHSTLISGKHCTYIKN